MENGMHDTRQTPDKKATWDDILISPAIGLHDSPHIIVSRPQQNDSNYAEEIFKFIVFWSHFCPEANNYTLVEVMCWCQTKGKPK